MDKRKTICIAALVMVAGFGWLYAQQESTVERRTAAPDFRFVADDGSVMLIMRERNFYENESAKIIVKDSGGKETTHELGAIRFFGYPWIIETPGWESQIALIPYHLGGGTGYGISCHCLVCVKGGVVHFEKMGLCRYWSVSPASPKNFTFELNPCLLPGALKGYPRLKFKSVIMTQEEETVVEGYVTIKVAVKDGNIHATLVPIRCEDALKCVELLNHRISEISEWAEEILANIVGREKMQDYRQSKRKRSGDEEQSTEEILKAIRSYYKEE